jgi:hypothetical protein
MQGTSRLRVTAIVVGIVAAGAFTAQAHAGVLAKSTFDTDADGWKVVGDTSSGTENATHVPTGGDPGGFISIDDAATGGVMYWRAPKTFRKAAEDAYKGSLAFSLRQSVTNNQFDADDIVIEAPGLTLVYNTSPNPAIAPGWTTYKVPLTKAGWTDATLSPEPATAKDMKDALKAAGSLLIRAEYQTGPDVDDLDTVTLKSNPKN